MWKKSCVLGFGTLFIGIVSGYGCSNDDTTVSSCMTTANPNTFPYRPALQAADKCSTAQITEFVSKCFSRTGSRQTCEDFVNAPAQDVCANECLFLPPANTANSGALIDLFLNQPGYASIVGASLSCVTAYHDWYACDLSACGGCAAGTPARTCDEQVQAPGGQCEADNKAFRAACSGAADQAALNRVDADIQGGKLENIFNAFCGKPVANDGGVDAGDSGTTDAGDAGDASTDAPVDG